LAKRVVGQIVATANDKNE